MNTEENENLKGIPRGVDYKLMHQGPQDLHSYEIRNDEDQTKSIPIDTYIELLVSKMDEDEQEIVRRYKFIFDGEVYPKSKKALNRIIENYCSNIPDDSSSNKELLLIILSIFYSLFPNHK